MPRLELRRCGETPFERRHSYRVCAPLLAREHKLRRFYFSLDAVSFRCDPWNWQLVSRMDSTLFRRSFFFLVFIVEFHAKVACTKEILITFDYLEISYYFRFYFSLDTVSFSDWNVSLLLR